ncbi:conserved hypothetical protein [Ricinus communis]|uniref:Uncharacterized protein n=1 Tax=Ricinus communis TaxID=3988 RepID=B9RL68_RICCO|nr:conserved hypothetical protein [Ricinus communis]
MSQPDAGGRTDEAAMQSVPARESSGSTEEVQRVRRMVNDMGRHGRRLSEGAACRGAGG